MKYFRFITIILILVLLIIGCAHSLIGKKVSPYNLAFINKEGGSANHNWEQFSFKCNYQINNNIIQISGELMLHNKMMKKGWVPEWGHVMFAFVDIDGIVVDVFREDVSFPGMSSFSQPVPIEAEFKLKSEYIFFNLISLNFTASA